MQALHLQVVIVSRSTVTFDRWKPREDLTWAMLVYQKHNAELTEMYMSHLSSFKFTYHELGKTAKFEDDIETHFPAVDEMKYQGLDNVKSWSDSFNKFDNWVNLNCIMAMSANLETYISTVVKLALESDVGILFGASRRIDGIEIVKYGRQQPFDFDEQLIGCTKGDWNSRINIFKKTFGAVPGFVEANISDLEKIRVLRNNVGHAFGRDIDKSRSHEAIEISRMTKVSRERTIEYLRLLFKVAKEIDKQLFYNNICSYQDLYFYHNYRKKNLNDTVINSSYVAASFKKTLSKHAAKTPGRNYCIGLIDYYESL